MLDRKPLTKSWVTHQEMPILLSLVKRILNKMCGQKASTTVTPLLDLQSDSFVNVRKGKSLEKACLLGKPMCVCVRARVCVCARACLCVCACMGILRFGRSTHCSLVSFMLLERPLVFVFACTRQRDTWRARLCSVLIILFCGLWEMLKSLCPNCLLRQSGSVHSEWVKVSYGRSRGEVRVEVRDRT